MNACLSFNALLNTSRTFFARALYEDKDQADNSKKLEPTLWANLPFELLPKIGAHIEDVETMNAWISAFTTSNKQNISPAMTLHFLQIWLPISLQKRAFIQNNGLRDLALTEPNMARCTKNTIETLARRYIQVLPSLQNLEEYKKVIENLQQCLSSNEITPKTKYWLQQKLIKNLANIPLTLWFEVCKLCDFSSRTISEQEKLSEQKLCKCLLNLADTIPEQSLSAVLLAIITKCFDADWEVQLPNMHINFTLSSLNAQLPRVPESDLPVLLKNLMQEFFPKLASKASLTLEVSTFQYMQEVAFNLLREGIDRLPQKEISSLLIVMAKNLSSWPPLIQGKAYGRLINQWIKNNEDKILLPLIKETHKWHWELIASLKFFSRVQAIFLKKLSPKFMAPVLIELIHQFKYWKSYYCVEQAITKALHEQLPHVSIDERAAILLALAENINSANITGPSAQILLDDYLPNLPEETQQSIRRKLAI